MPNQEKHMPVTLREITQKAEFQSLYPLIRLQNKSITKKEFQTLLSEMLPKGYRCVGAYEAGALVGIMGFWIGHRFWCKKYIDIDNAIVAESHRSKGIGKRLLAWVEKEAKSQNCTMAGLDSYTTAHKAHRFYLREGYCILGYHIIKHL